MDLAFGAFLFCPSRSLPALEFAPSSRGTRTRVGLFAVVRFHSVGADNPVSTTGFYYSICRIVCGTRLHKMHEMHVTVVGVQMVIAENVGHITRENWSSSFHPSYRNRTCPLCSAV